MTGRQQSQWILTPSVNPPPSTTLQFCHPDFYTVLSHLISQHNHSKHDLVEESSVRLHGGRPYGTPLHDERLPLSLPMQSSLQQLPAPHSPRNESQQTTIPASHDFRASGVYHGNSLHPSYGHSNSLNSSSNDAYKELSGNIESKASLGESRSDHRNRIISISSEEHGYGGEKRLMSVEQPDGSIPKLHKQSESSICVERKHGRCHDPSQRRLKTGADGSILLSEGLRNDEDAERNSGKGQSPQARLDAEEKTTCPEDKSLVHNLILDDVRSMGGGQLGNTERLLASAEECGMTLIFSNESSQLREQKAKSTKPIIEIDGVSVAVPIPGTGDSSSGLKFIFIPLDSSNRSLNEWCKNQLLRLLGCARVICYGAQEIVTTLINHFELHSQAEVWLKWRPLDVKVGTWLLDPDNVPDNFHHTLSRFNVPLLSQSNSAHQVCFHTCLCQDLSLLGPLMVRIYHQLVEHGLWQLFSDMETKLIPILGSMEAIGVKVDTDKLLHFDDLLKAAKRPFSINSTLQLRQVLFDELQLDKLCSKKLSKTQTLKLKSTSEAVLNQLQGLHPLPGLVLEYRQLCKIKATYIAGLLPFVSKKGVLHPCWQHTGAATGRLVSCTPNVQAFPKQAIQLGPVKKQFVVGKEKESHSVEVREAVLSRDGYSFMATDFRSIELRLLAHLSRDPALISTLTARPQTDLSSDVFTHLAAQWLSISVDKVLARDRERAKRVVYAIVYGVGKEKLAEILDMNSTAAKELMTSFLKRFPQVQSFMHQVVSETRGKGYTETICQRKRWFPQIKSANPHLRSYSERQAINFPIQGSAADVCKCGMIQVVEILASVSPRTRLLLQIHDELLFEVPDQDIELVAEKVKTVLESDDLIPSCKLKVPLEVRVSVGKNWAALRPYIIH